MNYIIHTIIQVLLIFAGVVAFATDNTSIFIVSSSSFKLSSREKTKKLADGGKPSTCLPPGRLVEHYSMLLICFKKSEENKKLIFL